MQPTNTSTFKNSATVTTAQTENITFDVVSHSVASNLLTVSLGDDFKCKFYGSKNNRMFAESFVLMNESGRVFSFRPGTPETMIEQFKAAVEQGFVFLFY